MRPLLYCAIVALVAAGAFRPFFPRFLLWNRAELNAAFTTIPGGRTPEFTRFLRQVALTTDDSASIALLFQSRRWAEGHPDGYSHAFYRATYLLVPRRVLPLVREDDSIAFENLDQAQLLATWGPTPTPPGFELIWSGHGGRLLRRR